MFGAMVVNGNNKFIGFIFKETKKEIHTSGYKTFGKIFKVNFKDEDKDKKWCG